MVRAVTHIHTRHSWDGIIKPRELVAKLKQREVRLALVTDHDTFAGSQEVAAIARREYKNLMVPLAAEVRTDFGDVIVVLDGPSTPPIHALKKWNTLVEVVRELRGLIWLPHPFRGHSDVRQIAPEADVIEVFNARCSNEENDKAQILCEEVSAAAAYGSDAHLLREVDRVLVEYEPRPSPQETLKGSPEPILLEQAKRSDRDRAEIVNGFKRRRIDLIGYFTARLMRDQVREWVGKVG